MTLILWRFLWGRSVVGVARLELLVVSSEFWISEFFSLLTGNWTREKAVMPIIPSPSQMVVERLIEPFTYFLSFFFLFIVRLKKAPNPAAVLVPRMVRGSGTALIRKDSPPRLSPKKPGLS